jgi:hypothetical protein
MAEPLIQTSILRSVLVSIPESVGLLAFGIGLVALAVLIRWLLARTKRKEEGCDTTK